MRQKIHETEGCFRIAVSAIIENSNGKILITKRSHTNDHNKNEWEIISGRIKPNETNMEEALKREILEETGINVIVITPFRSFYFKRGKEKVPHFGINFYCLYTGKDSAVKIDGVEQSAYLWVTPKKAITYIKNKSIREAITSYIDTKKRYQTN